MNARNIFMNKLIIDVLMNFALLIQFIDFKSLNRAEFIRTSIIHLFIKIFLAFIELNEGI